jgi:putative AlgH/UPF0301 family transcriptional regulator
MLSHSLTEPTMIPWSVTIEVLEDDTLCCDSVWPDAEKSFTHGGPVQGERIIILQSGAQLGMSDESLGNWQ